MSLATKFLALVTVAVGVEAPRPVTSQTTYDVAGLIADQTTAQPIAAGWVEVRPSNQRVGVDNNGSFRLSLRAGTHALRFHALGFRTLEISLDVRSDTTLQIALEYEPVAIEGITVEADRLARRGRAVPWSVRRVGFEDFMASAAADSVAVLQQRRMQLFPCRGGGECVRWRGSLIQPVVCIDERAAPGGLGELRTYPMASLYLVEVHDRGSMVRAYTTWFMERVRRGEMQVRLSLRTDAAAC